MNSRGGKKEKFSDKISLIYVTQIEAFNVSVRIRAERLLTFALAGKISKMYFLSCRCIFILPEIKWGRGSPLPSDSHSGANLIRARVEAIFIT